MEEREDPSPAFAPEDVKQKPTPSKNLESEEEAALDQVQELLDAVENLLEKDGDDGAQKQQQHDEISTDEQKQQQQEQQQQDGDGNEYPIQDLNSVKENTSPKSKNSQRLQNLLGEELQKRRRRIESTLRKLRARQIRLRRQRMKVAANLAKHPAIVKTRDATRRVITGSHDTRVRDFVVLPRVVRVLDQYTFTLGVLGIMVTEFVLLQYPELFRYYFVGVMGPMLSLRYVMYHRSKWQYFLMDFCYWVHGLSFILILFPNVRLPAFSGAAGSGNNEVWWHTLFVCANGPVLSAIVTWNNSFVFHSVDKVSSVYVHLLPAVLTWCERWRHHAVCDENMDHGGHLLYPLLFYLVWQVVYLFLTEVLDRDMLDADPDILTSLRFLTRANKSAVKLSLCRRVGIMAKDETFHPLTMKVKLIFVVGQFAYTLIMFLPGWLWYNYFGLHSLLLIFVISVSVYNGARYYVQVFSKIHEKRYSDEKQDSSSSGTNLSNDDDTTSNPELQGDNIIVTPPSLTEKKSI